MRSRLQGLAGGWLDAAHASLSHSALAMGVLGLGLLLEPAHGASIYKTRLEDPQAVYLTPDRFSVAADGLTDDAAALQEAIDQVAASNQPGVLFVPQGTYRLGKTVFVWPGVRLIGYGAKRPVFVLGENTPGFQDGEGKYMLFFSGGRGRGQGAPPRDGSPGTFYSAISNIDIEIRDGNPAAIGIRFHVAQHCFVSHMDLVLGAARAGLEDIGNEVEDLHFHGGDHGIVTGRSSPGWPILVIDCAFEGQRVAAISSREAGLAVVRPRFSNVPTAVSTAPGLPDQLWVSDALLENITGPAFIVSHEHSARTQINLENVVCHDVPTLVHFRESDRAVQESAVDYEVETWSHGLHLTGLGAGREIKTTSAIKPLATKPEAVPSDIPSLPPTDSWVNIDSLGVVGDGETDVTDLLKKAIAHHRTLYFPIGVYRVSDTLKLKPDTVLVGFNPGSTAVYLPNNTPGFQDPTAPKAIIETPQGGSNILCGIGVYPSPLNPAACAVKWMAGESSMMNDVRLHGGHGTRLPGGIGDSRGSDHRDRWDSQFPSLWITDGGGGVFKDIWTPSPYARAGMLISDTSTRGRLYAMSAEHHVYNEVIVRNASNWRFHALQFEEEREESPKALPLLIENCRDLQFANTFFYRVVSSFVPYRTATTIEKSKDIRFRNTHVYSNSKVSFDSSVFVADAKQEVRDPDFAVLDIPGDSARAHPESATSVLAPGAKVEQLADGFLNISGVAVDARGDPYFADPRELQIYRWSVARHQVEPVRRFPARPEQLAFDQAGNLLIVAYEGDGIVVALNLESPNGEPLVLPKKPAKERPGCVAVLPVNRWMGPDQFLSDSMSRKPHHYVSPDGTTFIPAGDDFATGAMSWGIKLSDLLRAFALVPAEQGKRFYVCNEAELQTWSFQVEPDGTLSDARLFVNEGGEGVAVDHAGRVYVAAGQIRVFDSAGELLEEIEVPQRPTSLAFGGPDRKTLFVTARSALYGVRVR